ncbi:ABC transporter permease [Staphylospora marina]|uniref:ABC transporter permease n=1 Tax=Staphylospora marina TaxID=2490858 RepID=UPI000F5C2073|nr:ABC transporter permease [Staphylospora marina]
MKRLIEWWKNPVLARETQWRMRSNKTPWVIFLYLTVTGGITLSILALSLDSVSGYNPDQSRFLFGGLAAVQLLMVSLVTPGLTAGLISGERERQTLSILLTTRLGTGQIVIGKWLAALSFMFLLLFATAPLYVMVYLFGGISTDALWKVFLHLLVTMLFFGSMGIYFSTVFKRTGVATVTAYLVTAGIGIGLPIILWLILLSLDASAFSGRHVPLITEIIGALHPLISLLFALTGEFLIEPDQLRIDFFQTYLIVYGVLSAIFLAGSVYKLSPGRFSRPWRTGRNAKQRSDAAGESA